jgi:hypothetical protein
LGKRNKKTVGNTVYTSCGFQSKLKVNRSLARAVTVDSEVATNSLTLHTLTVMGAFKKRPDKNTLRRIRILGFDNDLI